MGDWLLTQLGTGSGVSRSLCQPASGQGQGPAGTRVGSGLLWVGWVCRLQDHGSLESGVCPLGGETGLEASASFLEGGAGACPLVDGAGSWSSGGQLHV